MLDKLASDDFRPFLHQVFRLYLEPWQEEETLGTRAAPLELELVQVTDLGPAPEPEEDERLARRRPFSLIFQDSQMAYAPQQIYMLEHAVMGRLPLFLVPIGPNKKGMRYQAVFN
jgi:hypothetical protein